MIASTIAAPSIADAGISPSALPRFSYARLILEPMAIVATGTVVAVAASRGGPSLYVWTTALIFGLYAMSCNIMLGWAGRMSFGQAACFGAGAYLAALIAPASLPPVIVPILGGLAGLVVIVPVALIAVRSSGLMFAMLTFIWSGIIHQFVFSTELLGGENGLSGVQPFGVLGWQFFDYVPQAVTVAAYSALCLATLRWLQATNFGVALQATRDDSVRAALLGIPVRRVYLTAISIAGFIGGISGALIAQAQSTVDPGLFDWTLSGDGIVMALIGGQFTFWGPMIGAFILTVLRQLIFAGSAQSSLFVGLLLLVIVVLAPAGLLGVMDVALLKLPGYRWLRSVACRMGQQWIRPHGEGPARVTPRRAGAAALTVQDLTKSYRGVRALTGVNAVFEANQCTAVIGPNGAGKTTLFSVLSGQIAADSGCVALWGEDVTRAAASSRVHGGVSRTFQVARFFIRLSVLDNVLVAAAAISGGSAGWLSLFGRRREMVAAARDALDAVGLGAAAARSASTLSQAERKRLELAMVLVQSPDILLLDEPTAGLAKNDALAVLRLLRGLSALGTVTIVMTSHDMDVVFGLADRVVLMAQGAVAMIGAPDAVRTSDISRQVYLGTRSSRVAERPA